MPGTALIAALLAIGPVWHGDLSLGAGGWSRADAGEAMRGGLALLPAVDLSLAEPGTSWTLRYAPELFTGASSALLGTWQQGELRARLTPSRRLSLQAELNVGYGRAERLEPAWKHPLDAIALLRPIVDGELESSLELGGSYWLDPLDRLDVTGGYFARGATGVTARALEPFQQGPELYAAWDHSLSPIESVGAMFYGASTTTRSGTSSDGRLELVWSKDLSRTWHTRVSGGASLSSAPWQEQAAVSPSGSLELDWLSPAREGPGGLALIASFAPQTDPLTGERRDRAELGAALTRALSESWSAEAHGGVARALGLADFALAGGGLGYRTRDGWSLALDVDAVHEHAATDQTALRIFTRAAYALHDVF
jgi:hypothetical protein